MSFGPFLGGKSICLGKTFAENIAKCVIPIIASQINFEFVDPLFMTKKPYNSFTGYINVPVIVRVTKV